MLHQKPPWDWGQGKLYTAGMQGKHVCDPPGLLHVQTDRNKSQIMSGFGKSLRGKFSQAEGLNFIHENIYAIKVKASRILWDRKLVRVRFTPLIYYPVSWVMSTWVNFHLHLSACLTVFYPAYAFLLHLILQAGWSFPTRNGKIIFLYRCWGHPEEPDSGSRQRRPCGLSAVGVKATSYPWLTWRTPTVTTVSSEKQLCGYA